MTCNTFSLHKFRITVKDTSKDLDILLLGNLPYTLGVQAQLKAQLATDNFVITQAFSLVTATVEMVWHVGCYQCITLFVPKLLYGIPCTGRIKMNTMRKIKISNCLASVNHLSFPKWSSKTNRGGLKRIKY